MASSTCIYSYSDNISVSPATADFSIDVMNVKCSSGGTVNFSLDAGASNANKDYWIWMTLSGTYPGFTFSGIPVPLNQDILFQTGLSYPLLPGTTGFFAALDGAGQATASVDMPVDRPHAMMNIPINFAYVLLSPGPSAPITYASLPVLIKYIP